MPEICPYLTIISVKGNMLNSSVETRVTDWTKEFKSVPLIRPT